MMLATERVSSETTLAVAAVNSMAIEVETQALVRRHMYPTNPTLPTHR